MKNLYENALKLHMHKIYALCNPVFSQILELEGLASFFMYITMRHDQSFVQRTSAVTFIVCCILLMMVECTCKKYFL